MKNIKIIAMAALVAVSLSPITAQAQDAPTAQQQDVYSDFYDAMESGIDQELILDTMVNAVAAQMLAGDPRLAALEEEHPGVTMDLVNSMRPILSSYSERIRVEYRPQMVAAARDIFTESEAISLAEFYTSDIGRSLIVAASNNLTVENVLDTTMDGNEVTADDVNRDMQATGERAFAGMSEEDQAELMIQAMTTPGFAKLPLLQQRIAPIRAQMEAAPPTPEEAAGIVEAVGGVIAQYAL